jgi:hypothetical protein
MFSKERKNYKLILSEKVNNYKKIISSSIILSFIIFTSIKVDAYREFHPPWKDDQIPIKYEIVAPCDDLGEELTEIVIKKAFHAWSKIPCSKIYGDFQGWTNNIPSGNLSVPKSDLHNVIYFTHNWSGLPGIAPGATRCINRGTEAVECDVFIRDSIKWEDTSQSQYPVSLVLLHEIGHFIGLHEHPSRNAIMHQIFNPKKKPELTSQDIDWLCKIYPCPTGKDCTRICKDDNDCLKGDQCNAEGQCIEAGSIPPPKDGGPEDRSLDDSHHLDDSPNNNNNNNIGCSCRSIDSQKTNSWIWVFPLFAFILVLSSKKR